MSHIDLLLNDVPLQGPQSGPHVDLARERLALQERRHALRIANIALEKDIVMGNVWQNKEVPEGSRRVTDSTGHQIINTLASLLLPKPPNITFMPLSQQPQHQREADAMTRWTYAALDNLRAYEYFNAWAKELMFGAAALHMTPDPYAIDGEEVPVNLDVPLSASILYQLGPRNRPDYVFIKHRFSAREAGRLFNMKVGQRETDMLDVWCYYCEERYKLDGRTQKMVLYGIMYSGKFLYPLTDVSAILPEIPVFMAFNSDGYNWADREEMRGLGVLTLEQERLMFASDYLSALANGTLRNINPALVIEQEDVEEDKEISLAPNAVNVIRTGESIKRLDAVGPTKESYEFFPEFMQGLASATVPQLFLPTQELSGVSGSAFSESMHPLMVRNRVRQMSLEGAMANFIRVMLRHLATVVDPVEGLTLYGVDPRDQSQLMEMATPDVMLRNTRINVQLSQQTPRSVFQYVQLLQTLGDQGYLPRQLVTEQVAELMNLPVRDMTSVMDQIAADEDYKLRMDVLKQQAQQAYPQLRQEMWNREQQPLLNAQGEAPYRMSSEGVDPVMQGEMNPQNMGPQIPRPSGNEMPEGDIPWRVR
jgi:hypothetical protein